MMIFRLSFLLKVGQMKVCQYPYLLSTFLMIMIMSVIMLLS